MILGCSRPLCVVVVVINALFLGEVVVVAHVGSVIIIFVVVIVVIIVMGRHRCRRRRQDRRACPVVVSLGTSGGLCYPAILPIRCHLAQNAVPFSTILSELARARELPLLISG